MPRMGRVMPPNHPHHVVQRGHNRQVVFAEQRDYLRYLEALAEFKLAFGVRVYAYCLMTNHVHLLLAPGEEVAGLGRLMKRLAGRQTHYHNTLESRTGTLWESRYRSSPVDIDEYSSACVRYIELNPVRARMADVSEAYRWSSARHHLGVEPCHWLDDDPCYLALGDAAAVRQARHQEFLNSAIPEGEWALVRAAVQRGQLTGKGRFVDQVQGILGRRIEHRSPGRPARKPTAK